MKSYVFKVELVQDEDDGGWSAIIPVLPGCAADGDTPEEAVEYVRELAQAYIEVLVEDGRPIPQEGRVAEVEGAAVAVLAG
jgi:antitoxin HicB